MESLKVSSVLDVKRSRIDIPYSAGEEKVYLKRWDKYNEDSRWDLVISTKNQYVSLSLSRTQMKLLKEAVDLEKI